MDSYRSFDCRHPPPPPPTDKPHLSHDLPSPPIRLPFELFAASAMPFRRYSPGDLPETQYVSLSGDSQNLWEAESILDERGAAGTGSYLVKWKGTDPETGKSYEPTWETKSGCTSALIWEWKRLKNADPSVVGKAGKELELAKRRERARKRPRYSKHTGNTLKKKPRKGAGTGGSRRSYREVAGLILPGIEQKTPQAAESSSSIRTRSTFSPSPSSGPAPEDDTLRLRTLAAGSRIRHTSSKLPPDEIALDRVIKPSPLPVLKPSSSSTVKTPSLASDGKRRLLEVEVGVSRKDPESKRSAIIQEDADGTEPVAPVKGLMMGRAEGQQRPGFMGDTSVMRDVVAERTAEKRGDIGTEVSIPDGEIVERALDDEGRSKDHADRTMTFGKAMSAPIGDFHRDGAIHQTSTFGEAVIDIAMLDGRKAAGLKVQTQAQDKVVAKQEEIHHAPTKEKTINMPAITPAQAGPGPTTKANMQNRENLSGLGPVPQPSPSIFRPFLPTLEDPIHTQTEGSVPISQLDPIVDFSSPARLPPIGNGPYLSRDVDYVAMIQDTTVDGEDMVKNETIESIPPRVVKRIIDGDEVFAVFTESMSDEDGGGLEPDQVEPRNAHDQDWKDENLALMTSSTVRLPPFNPAVR